MELCDALAETFTGKIFSSLIEPDSRLRGKPTKAFGYNHRKE